MEENSPNSFEKRSPSKHLILFRINPNKDKLIIKYLEKKSRFSWSSASGSSTSNDTIDLKSLKRTKTKSKGRKRKAKKSKQQPQQKSTVTNESQTDVEKTKENSITVVCEAEQHSSTIAANNEQSDVAENAFVEMPPNSNELLEQCDGNLMASNKI